MNVKTRDTTILQVLLAPTLTAGTVRVAGPTSSHHTPHRGERPELPDVDTRVDLTAEDLAAISRIILARVTATMTPRLAPFQAALDAHVAKLAAEPTEPS